MERQFAVRAIPVDDRELLIKAVRLYLNDRSPAVRAEAVEVVCKQFLWELEDRIHELLFDKQGYVRRVAVECLGDFYGEQRFEVPWLYPLLGDPDDLVRVETLESLAYIGDRKALPLMVERLADEDSLVRSYAAYCTAQLGGKRYRKLIEAASDVEETETTRPWFARALFMLGDVKQFGRLVELLTSPSATARCATANALAELSLSPEQVEIALAAVSQALQNFLYRSDQEAMRLAQESLRERLDASAL
jgi:HEAT repeat protein